MKKIIKENLKEKKENVIIKASDVIRLLNKSQVEKEEFYVKKYKEYKNIKKEYNETSIKNKDYNIVRDTSFKDVDKLPVVYNIEIDTILKEFIASNKGITFNGWERTKIHFNVLYDIKSVFLLKKIHKKYNIKLIRCDVMFIIDNDVNLSKIELKQLLEIVEYNINIISTYTLNIPTYNQTSISDKNIFLRDYVPRYDGLSLVSNLLKLDNEIYPLL